MSSPPIIPAPVASSLLASIAYDAGKVGIGLAACRDFCNSCWRSERHARGLFAQRSKDNGVYVGEVVIQSGYGVHFVLTRNPA